MFFRKNKSINKRKAKKKLAYIKQVTLDSMQKDHTFTVK